MVNDIILAAFAKEMQKIANLRVHVGKAKSGKYVDALMGLAKDNKSKNEALERFLKLQASGNLPQSLRGAPVPRTVPKGFVATASTTRNLLSWLNKNKGNPGFKRDAIKALDDAMELKL